MYENIIRGSEPMHDFEGSDRPAIIAGSRNPSASLVPATPLHVANPHLRAAAFARSANQGNNKSRSHLYSPTISQAVDAGTTREIFHLSPTSANAAWKSIHEEEELILDPEAGRNRQIGVRNPMTASLSRQQSIDFSAEVPSDDALNQKVVVL
jgi:hypothetical protein